MKRRSYIRYVAALAIVVLCASPMLAQDQSTNAAFGTKEVVPINVLVGQSKLITFDRPIERFSVSNPDIAEAVLVAGDQVVVNGKAFGQINFIAWEKGTGRFLVFDVYVRTNLSLIDSQVHALWPKDDIRLSQANGSVVISGSVSDPSIATQIDAVVQAAGFKTVNLLQSPVKNSLQVQLMVRVAEVSRNRMRELGTSYGYQASPGSGGYINSGGGPSSLGDVTGGILSGSISSGLNLFIMGGNSLSFIRALQQQGALRALAEPNLIAMNGQEALQMFDEHKHNLILMDLNMPVMDGYAATGELRKRGVKHPIIALTASIPNSEKEDIVSLGCTDIILKPFNPNVFINTLMLHLKPKNKHAFKN